MIDVYLIVSREVRGCCYLPAKWSFLTVFYFHERIWFIEHLPGRMFHCHIHIRLQRIDMWWHATGFSSCRKNIQGNFLQGWHCFLLVHTDIFVPNLSKNSPRTWIAPNQKGKKNEVFNLVVKVEENSAGNLRSKPEKGSSIASLKVMYVIYSLHHGQEGLGKCCQLRVEERWIILSSFKDKLEFSTSAVYHYKMIECRWKFC